LADERKEGRRRPEKNEPKTNKVSTDSNGTAGHQSDGEDFIVGLGRLTGNQAGALKVLNTNTIRQTNDVRNYVPVLTVLRDLLCLHRGLEVLAQSLEILRGQEEVLEALLGVLRHVPRDLEAADHLLGDANASTRVGRDVDPWDSKFPGERRGLEEELKKKKRNEKGRVTLSPKHNTRREPACLPCLLPDRKCRWQK